MPFETPLPPGFFDVTITTAAVREYGGVNPTTIIRTDQAWDVQIEWQTSGSIVSWVAGDWHLMVCLESIGNGPEFNLTDPNETVVPVATQPHLYQLHPDFPAGTVPAGTYMLVVVITYTDRNGNPGQMAGHWQSPIIQFYTP